MKPLSEAEVEWRYKEFPITSVCRADLEGAGFDAEQVYDGSMIYIASKMADAYCDMGFWEELEAIAEHMEIKRREKPAA